MLNIVRDVLVEHEVATVTLLRIDGLPIGLITHSSVIIYPSVKSTQADEKMKMERD